MKATAIKLIKQAINDALTTSAQALTNKSEGENVATVIDLINSINAGRKKIPIPANRKSVTYTEFIAFFPEVAAKINANQTNAWQAREKLAKKYQPLINKLELDLVLGDDLEGRKSVEALLEKIRKEA